MRHANFWSVQVEDGGRGEGNIVFWGRTRKEAVASAQEFIDTIKDEYPDAHLYTPHKHRCELSSWGFVAWLNRNFTHDNG